MLCNKTISHFIYLFKKKIPVPLCHLSILNKLLNKMTSYHIYYISSLLHSYGSLILNV